MLQAAPAQAPRRPHPLLVGCVYLASWAVLDALALRFETAPEIQIWYPPAGLDLALLLVCGLRYWPLLALNTVLHILITNRPLPFSAFVLFDTITTAGYLLAAATLFRLRINPRLRQLRDVTLLIGIGSLLAPLLIATAQAANFAWHGLFPWSEFPVRLLHYWAGDATGVAMLTPLLLVVLRRYSHLWARSEDIPTPPNAPFSWPNARTLMWLVGEASIISVIFWVAYGAPRGADLDYTYLIYLPLIWIALRYEFVGALLGVLALNIGVALMVFTQIGATQMLLLQFGLMITSQTSILLGAFMSDRRQQAETQLRLERQALERQRFESIGRLAAGVAHDVNNLVTVIRGNADLALLEVAPNSDAAHSVRAILHATNRATDLTQRLLAAGRRQTLVYQPLDVAALTNETVALVRTTAPAQISLRTVIDDVVPPVRGDRTELRQVLLNLLTNAVDALQANGGVITVRVAVTNHTAAPAVLPPGVYVLIEVGDTGPGMDADTVAQIFEPFFSTKKNGHGLGLATVQSITAAHGGTVVVASALGGGTTFSVLLPADITEVTCA